MPDSCGRELPSRLRICAVALPDDLQMTEVQMAKPYASYRRLLGNSKAALTAAIEICNKPNMDYREECFVILLVNAWGSC